MTVIEVDICQSSNGVIANVVHHDLDTNFQGKKMLNANVSETVKIGAEMCNVFYRLVYLSSNDNIADAVLHHVDLHVQGQTFYCN